MGMTLKELLTKGEGTISAKEAKALAAQCRMDEETLYTLLEERGIKVLEEDAEPTLDVDSIMAEVENAENNNDDMGISEDEEEQSEENPADLKAAMDELLDDPVKNYLKQIGQIPLLSAEQEVELSRRIHAGAEAAHILQADRQKYGGPEYIKKNSARFSFEEDENSRSLLLLSESSPFSLEAVYSVPIFASGTCQKGRSGWKSQKRSRHCSR